MSGLPISCATPAARSRTARVAPARSSSSVRSRSAVTSLMYTSAPVSVGTHCTSTVRSSGYVTSSSRLEARDGEMPSDGMASAGSIPRRSFEAGLLLTTTPCASRTIMPIDIVRKSVSSEAASSESRAYCSRRCSASILPMCRLTPSKNPFTQRPPSATRQPASAVSAFSLSLNLNTKTALSPAPGA